MLLFDFFTIYKGLRPLYTILYFSVEGCRSFVLYSIRILLIHSSLYWNPNPDNLFRFIQIRIHSSSLHYINYLPFPLRIFIFIKKLNLFNFRKKERCYKVTSCLSHSCLVRSILPGNDLYLSKSFFTLVLRKITMAVYIPPSIH